MPLFRPGFALFRNATERFAPALCCRPLGLRAALRIASKRDPGVHAGSLVAAGFTAVLICCTTASFAASATGTLAVRIAAPASHPANTMAVTDASGAASTNYPLQFGRPFLEGAVARGRCPVVSMNGVALPTQADVKNRYPDGSVEFAVVAVVLPSIPANGSVQLSFAPGSCNNAPLTSAQMLDPSYNFDAQEQLVASTPAKLVGEPVPQDTIAQYQAFTNGGFTLTVNGTVTHITGINMSTLGSDWSGYLSLLQAHMPAGLVASVPNTGSGVVELSTTATGPTQTISFATAPTDGSQDMSAFLGLIQGQGGTITAGATVSASASARTMLTNGDYTLWTSGPVAQTIILADDTPTRKYDLGLGDGYHPFRPRFEATFWPATHQVFVRAIGENDLSTELEDLRYSLTLTGANAKIYSNPRLTQGAMATWTRRFWLGGTPNPQVNIDNNLAYLESTRFVPNYDPSLTVDPTALANDYAAWWTNATPTAIGGDTGWTPGMPTTGAR
ncbi:MAG: DUF3383 family protein, partial [Stellaceae bacterium]